MKKWVFIYINDVGEEELGDRLYDTREEAMSAACSTQLAEVEVILDISRRWNL
jgi:hypothetical protein